MDLNFLTNVATQLIKASGTSLAIAFFASCLGFIGGTILGVLQSGNSKFAKYLIGLYVTIFRGTPMLLQIMFFYLLSLQMGFNISAFTVAIISIGLNSSAYISQVIRSGIKSVPQGQIEAAQTLGISNFNITRYIILPQAIQIVIPALANEFITLIKDSSLASLIGVVELYKRGSIIISQTHDAITVYILMGLIYLILTTTLSIIVLKLENKLNKQC